MSNFFREQGVPVSATFRGRVDAPAMIFLEAL